MKVLISSHSNAYDIWEITYFFQQKYWKNVNVFLGANGEDRKEFVPNEWKYINKGRDESFSKSLLGYLEEIKEDYFILMLDDFLILEPVDNSLINLAFDFIKEQKGVYLRLTPNPRGDKKFNKYFSRIAVENKVPYITSLQMAIWNKNFLKELLKYDFSPWEFETKAGKTKEALENYDKFFVTNFPFVKYTHFLEKGKFYPFIKELVKKENIEFNFKRPFYEPKKENFFKELFYKVVPPKYINTIRRIFNRQEL